MENKSAKASLIDKVAWVYTSEGKVLCARSKGKETFYIPGGKRESGETDQETLIREIEEELNVRIKPETIRPFGQFKAAAHDKPEGSLVQISCYTAEFAGDLQPASEIAQLAFLGSMDRDKVSAVSGLIFDRLHELKLID